jgi:sugar phosphate isomerase/epimerase
MDKVKAGWIGFIRREDDFWACAARLRELGYRGFEGADFLLRENADENVKRLRDLDIKALTISTSVNELEKENYGEILSRARAVGADRATIWGSGINASFSGNEPQYDVIMKEIGIMEKAAKKLKAEGLQLCYHNHYQEFVTYFNEIAYFDILLANTEALRYELDVAWVANGLQDPAMVMRRIAPRLSIIHVKDYINGEPRVKEPGFKPIFVSVGNGVLDLPPVLEAACELDIEWSVVEQDQMHNLSAMDSLTAAYLNMKETGRVL